MNMTISKGCALQNFPTASGLKDGQSIRVTVPSSSSPSGSTVVNIKRMTAEYFYVSEIK